MERSTVDWLLWIDEDAYFMNHDIPLERFIPEGDGLRHLPKPSEPCGPVDRDQRRRILRQEQRGIAGDPATGAAHAKRHRGGDPKSMGCSSTAGTRNGCSMRS